MSVALTPMMSEARMPYISSVKTSRPRWSVKPQRDGIRAAHDELVLSRRREEVVDAPAYERQAERLLENHVAPVEVQPVFGLSAHLRKFIVALRRPPDYRNVRFGARLYSAREREYRGRLFVPFDGSFLRRHVV